MEVKGENDTEILPNKLDTSRSKEKNTIVSM